MPTYEYACRSCGTHVEVFQRISDEPLSVCGNCGGPLRKVFHPAGILLKGSGFYKTDSRTKGAGSSDGSKSGEREPSKTSSAAGSGDGKSPKEGKSSSDAKSSSGEGSAGASTKAKEQSA